MNRGIIFRNTELQREEPPPTLDQLTILRLRARIAQLEQYGPNKPGVNYPPWLEKMRLTAQRGYNRAVLGQLSYVEVAQLCWDIMKDCDHALSGCNVNHSNTTNMSIDMRVQYKMPDGTMFCPVSKY